MKPNDKELTLLDVGNKIGFHVSTLGDLKERLPEVPKEDLVDGFIAMKDTGKELESVVKLVRDEILSNRMDAFDKKDEKGHLYFSGNNYNLKLEYRVMKPVLNQEKAFDFFKERGLLSKVVDVSVNFHRSQIEDLLYVLKSFSNTKSKFYDMLGIVSTESVKEVKNTLQNLVQMLEEKATVTVSEEKISALIALGELSVDDVEHLFTTQTTYAFKEKK